MQIWLSTHPKAQNTAYNINNGQKISSCLHSAKWLNLSHEHMDDVAYMARMTDDKAADMWSFYTCAISCVLDAVKYLCISLQLSLCRRTER